MQKNHCGDLAIFPSCFTHTHVHTQRLHMSGLSQSYIVRSLIHILAERLASFPSADVGMLRRAQCEHKGVCLLTCTQWHIHNAWPHPSFPLSRSHTNTQTELWCDQKCTNLTVHLKKNNQKIKLHLFNKSK